jgi:hypothetical protein
VRPTIICTQFCEGDESGEKCSILGLLKLKGLRAAAISMIAIEDFVIAEEFGQIYFYHIYDNLGFETLA